MKLKITCTLLGLFCVLLNSCRETEELDYSDTVLKTNVMLKSDNKESNPTVSHELELGDPPIKGTHWKVGK